MPIACKRFAKICEKYLITFVLRVGRERESDREKAVESDRERERAMADFAKSVCQILYSLLREIFIFELHLFFL